VGFLLFPFRLVALILWVIIGLATVMMVFPMLTARWRQWAIKHWSRGLLACCGVKVRRQGEPKLTGAVLWVANHVSWVDIFVLDSVRAAAFIAKSDIRQWPLLGWLVAGAGTLFIERGRRHAVRVVGHQMKHRFDAGEAVGLFPESTTSDGFDVMPFHTSLFEPALRAGVDVQPIALLYKHQGRRTSRYAFVGDQNLLHNVWNLLTSTGTVVEMVFCPVITAAECAELGRARVAHRAQQEITAIVAAPSAAPCVVAQPLRES